MTKFIGIQEELKKLLDLSKKKSANIAPNEVVSENPFYQHKIHRNLGCQIDYLIQTKFNTLYVCEIKFSKNMIDSSVIDEVQKKIDVLSYPKGYSCRPVLVHVNGVTEDIIDSDYFALLLIFQHT